MAEATVKELNDTQEELMRTWKNEFQEYQQREEQERKQFRDALTDTKETLDRIQDRLDELEAQKKTAQKEREESTDFEGPESKDADTFWNDYIRKGNQGPEVRKKLSTDDDTAGGFLAPGEFVQDLIQDIVEISPVRSVARVRTTSRRFIMIPKRTQTAAAVWAEEGGTRSETQNPSYGMEQVFNHALHALALVTWEDLEDSVFDMEQFLREEFREQFAKSEGSAFLTGDGNGKPEGILTSSDVRNIQSGASNTFDEDSLVNTYYNIKTPYTGNAVWMLNRLSIREVRKLKDANDQFLWQPGLAENRQPTILEAPYVEATDLAAPNDSGNFSTGDKPIVFGNFQQGYTIVDRIATTIQRLVEKYSDEGAVGFQARKRVGGQVTKGEAICTMTIGT